MCTTLTDSNLLGAIITSSRHNTQITNDLKTKCYATSFILKRWSLENRRSSDKGWLYSLQSIKSWLGHLKSIEELETLPAGTKPRTSHHQQPKGEKWRERKCSKIDLKRPRKSHQSGWHWNRFKGSQYQEHLWETGGRKFKLFWAHGYLLAVT